MNEKKNPSNQPPIALKPDVLNDYFLNCPRKLLSTTNGEDLQNQTYNIDERLKNQCNRKKDTKRNLPTHY